MFGLGFWETIIILVVALVFIGPNKLPEVARTIGKGVRSMRKAMAGLEEEVNRATRIADPRFQPPRSSEPASSRYKRVDDDEDEA